MDKPAMSKHNKERKFVERNLQGVLVIVLLLAVSLPASAQFLKLNIGPSKGEVAAAVAGVGAAVGVTVLVLYLTLHHPEITGCVQSANGAFNLTNDNDHLTYTLVDEGSSLKAGERVKLRGKKKKDKQGQLSFRVSKIKKDYGSCQP